MKLQLRLTRRSAIAGAVIVALAAVIVIPRVLGGSTAEDGSALLTPVRIATPARGHLEQSVRFSGNLKAQATTTVISKVPGKVLSILVKENQRVKAGDVLARIEDDIVRLQMEQAEAGFAAASAQLQKATTAVRPEELESAKASLAQAEEDLTVARSSLERTRKLYESGTVAKSKFEEAENAVRNAETKIDNARRQVKLMEEGARKEDIAMARAQADSMSKQLEMARLQLDFATIRSPISGTVAKVHVDAGNMVGQTSPLITIISDGAVFAMLTVPERYYGFFAGDWRSFTTTVAPLAYRDRPPFPGTISQVAGYIDGNTRSFEVEVAVENPGGVLRPGMYVDVAIASKSPEETVLVPRDAVLLRNGEQVVFAAAEDGPTPRVSMKPVTLGKAGRDQVQVLAGLKGNERIVVEGNAFLEDGQRVGTVGATPAEQP